MKIEHMQDFKVKGEIYDTLSLSKIINEDGTERYEVLYENEGVSDSFEPVYFDTEREARSFIEDELN